MRKKVFILICLLVTFPVFAWDAGGHRVIAQIAYDHLTPTAKKRINNLLKTRFYSKYRDGRFLKAAVWPDQLRIKIKQHASWHFIDLPWAAPGIKFVPPYKHNVVWAIKRSENKVQDYQLPKKERAKYLSFLIHFVGDVHQPLHCIVHYTKRFPPPKGDWGGNNFRIHSKIANNLHAYWDAGLGQFIGHKTKHYLSYYHVVRLVNQWQKMYPVSYFKSQLTVQSPMRWAEESYQLAKQSAYQLPINSKPSRHYNKIGRRIVREQAVLAGYRLAEILNHIFSQHICLKLTC